MAYKSKEIKHIREKAWRDANRDKLRANNLRYYLNNRDRILALRKEQTPVVREARRWAEIKRRYGLSEDQFEVILKSQNNKCAICKRRFTQTPLIDHCGKYGHVRGLLCVHCNTAIGMMKHSVRVTRSALIYLSKEVLFNGGYL